MKHKIWGIRKIWEIGGVRKSKAVVLPRELCLSLGFRTGQKLIIYSDSRGRVILECLGTEPEGKE